MIESRGSILSNLSLSLSPSPSQRVQLKASEKQPLHHGRQECQQPKVSNLDQLIVQAIAEWWIRDTTWDHFKISKPNSHETKEHVQIHMCFFIVSPFYPLVNTQKTHGKITIFIL